jgi:cyanuric acid amidohydrolase
VSTKHVNLVLIKCPLLPSSKIDAIRAAGQEPITMDTYESMAKSRYASALGISVALEELGRPFVESALGKEEKWTAKASCSSGAELEKCHILLLVSDPSSGSLRAVSSVMEDAIDARSIIDALG